MKKLIVLLVASVLMTGCGKLELTEKEEKYIKDAYLATQFTKDIFDEFAESAKEFEDGGSSAKEMFGHMLVFTMLEQSVEKLPDAPEQYSHITDDLAESLSMFQESVIGVSVGIGAEDSVKKEEMLAEDLENMNKAVDLLLGVEEELVTVMKEAKMEKEMQEIQSEAKEISVEVMKALE